MSCEWLIVIGMARAVWRACSEIKSRSTQATSDSYAIDPDGEGGYIPFTVYGDTIDKKLHVRSQMHIITSSPLVTFPCKHV